MALQRAFTAAETSQSRNGWSKRRAERQRVEYALTHGNVVQRPPTAEEFQELGRELQRGNNAAFGLVRLSKFLLDTPYEEFPQQDRDCAGADSVVVSASSSSAPTRTLLVLALRLGRDATAASLLRAGASPFLAPAAAWVGNDADSGPTADEDQQAQLLTKMKTAFLVKAQPMFVVWILKQLITIQTPVPGVLQNPNCGHEFEEKHFWEFFLEKHNRRQQRLRCPTCATAIAADSCHSSAENDERKQINQALLDRPGFVEDPSSCAADAVRALMFGRGSSSSSGNCERSFNHAISGLTHHQLWGLWRCAVSDYLQESPLRALDHTGTEDQTLPAFHLRMLSRRLKKSSRKNFYELPVRMGVSDTPIRMGVSCAAEGGGGGAPSDHAPPDQAENTTDTNDFMICPKGSCSDLSKRKKKKPCPYASRKTRDGPRFQALPLFEVKKMYIGTTQLQRMAEFKKAVEGADVFRLQAIFELGADVDICGNVSEVNLNEYGHGALTLVCLAATTSSKLAVEDCLDVLRFLRNCCGMESSSQEIALCFAVLEAAVSRGFEDVEEGQHQEGGGGAVAPGGEEERLRTLWRALRRTFYFQGEAGETTGSDTGSDTEEARERTVAARTNQDRSGDAPDFFLLRRRRRKSGGCLAVEEDRSVDICLPERVAGQREELVADFSRVFPGLSLDITACQFFGDHLAPSYFWISEFPVCRRRDEAQLLTLIPRNLSTLSAKAGDEQQSHLVGAKNGDVVCDVKFNPAALRCLLAGVNQKHPGAGSYVLDGVFENCFLWFLKWVFWAALPWPADEDCKKKSMQPNEDGVVFCNRRKFLHDCTGYVSQALKLALLGPSSCSCSSSPENANAKIPGLKDVILYSSMRYLYYDRPSSAVPPHTDLARTDASGRTSTHTFVLYLNSCGGEDNVVDRRSVSLLRPLGAPVEEVVDSRLSAATAAAPAATPAPAPQGEDRRGEKGGETALLRELPGPKNKHTAERICEIAPRPGRLLLFPHACPHEGRPVLQPTKLLLRGEIKLVFETD